MLDFNVIKELRKIVGKDNVLTSEEEKVCYSYDAMNIKYIPDAVIFPSSAKEISEILKVANREKFPVIPRGAGTGFTGGSLAVSGGVVMTLTKMNKIISINPDNLTAEVEPGVVTYDLKREVEKFGLFYPPDPSSQKMCTIGGNIAECSSGPNAVKYGVTKDYVLGLEAVLPTGEIINTGTKTIKGVVGYDLTKLIVGSEGTLAVVTKLSLRLLPAVQGKKTMIAYFKSVHNAAKSVSDIIKNKVLPSALEFLDKSTISCIRDRFIGTKFEIPADSESLLIIEVDGKYLNDELKAINESLMKNDVINVILASNDSERDGIWDLRRSISPSITKLAPKKINEDIVVPRDIIPVFIKLTEKLAKKMNLKIATFGHAGDGTLHVNIMIDDKDDDEVKRAESALNELFKNVISLGGTLSGEHGVGVAKAPYIGLELSKTEIDLMKKIKKLFDPNNILNPNKIFYEKK